METLQLRTVTRALRFAAHDSKVRGVLLLGQPVPGRPGPRAYAALREVARALADFHAAGKPVVAYLDYATTGTSTWRRSPTTWELDPYGVIMMPGSRASPGSSRGRSRSTASGSR